MHGMLSFYVAAMGGVGYIAEKQFPDRHHPLNKVGSAMLCLSIIGSIILNYPR